MRTIARLSSGARILRELEEFAAFPPETQAYIRHSLEIRDRCREVPVADTCDDDAGNDVARIAFYGRLEQISAAIPVDDDIASVTTLMRWLVPITAFELAHTALGSFAAFRFLYERLLGAAVRPWLLGAFCTAAAMPQLHPQHRQKLLQSIGEAGCGAPSWSIREPLFFPESIDAEAN